jgi:hypothetical protein
MKSISAVPARYRMPDRLRLPSLAWPGTITPREERALP